MRGEPQSFEMQKGNLKRFQLAFPEQSRFKIKKSSNEIRLGKSKKRGERKGKWKNK